MGKSKGWHDAFFGNLYQRVLANQFSVAQTKVQLAMVRRLLRLRKPMRVLDVPCGMGRLTLPLAEQGLGMTGVDFNASYLRRARREARGRNLDIRFVRADMRRVRPPPDGGDLPHKRARLSGVELAHESRAVLGLRAVGEQKPNDEHAGQRPT